MCYIDVKKCVRLQRFHYISFIIADITEQEQEETVGQREDTNVETEVIAQPLEECKFKQYNVCVCTLAGVFLLV